MENVILTYHEQKRQLTKTLILLGVGILLTIFQIELLFPSILHNFGLLGQFLIFLSLWKMRKINHDFSISFRLSILYFLLLVPGLWIDGLPSDNDFSLFIMILSIILMLLRICYLLSGLKELALSIENESLANNFSNCFVIYLTSYILMILSSVLSILFAGVVLLFLVLIIYLLKSIYHLSDAIDKSLFFPDSFLRILPFNKNIFGGMIVYVATFFTGLFIILCIVNIPNPEQEPYANDNLSIHTQEAYDKLKAFGMDDFILNDLSEEELLQHIEILDYSQSSQTHLIDDGSLEMTICKTRLSENIRLILYYRWKELPQNHYVDSFFLLFPDSGSIIFDSTSEINRISLHDISDITYKQTPLSPDVSISRITTSLKYRLYPDYENQRGYITCEFFSPEPDTMLDSNFIDITLYYIHQNSFLNYPYTEATTVFQQKGDFDFDPMVHQMVIYRF